MAPFDSASTENLLFRLGLLVGDAALRGGGHVLDVLEKRALGGGRRRGHPVLSPLLHFGLRKQNQCNMRRSAQYTEVGLSCAFPSPDRTGSDRQRQEEK